VPFAGQLERRDLSRFTQVVDAPLRLAEVSGDGVDALKGVGADPLHWRAGANATAKSLFTLVFPPFPLSDQPMNS
jgi:hypothetical protein